MKNKSININLSASSLIKTDLEEQSTVKKPYDELLAENTKLKYQLQLQEAVMDKLALLHGMIRGTLAPHSPPALRIEYLNLLFDTFETVRR